MMPAIPDPPCPVSGAADQLFAKGILYEKCRDNGTPCLLYDDFGDIRRCLGKSLGKGGCP